MLISLIKYSFIKINKNKAVNQPHRQDNETYSQYVNDFMNNVYKNIYININYEIRRGDELKKHHFLYNRVTQLFVQKVMFLKSLI